VYEETLKFIYSMHIFVFSSDAEYLPPGTADHDYAVQQSATSNEWIIVPFVPLSNCSTTMLTSSTANVNNNKGESKGELACF